MRLREYSESVPKPMVPIGYRPIIWHLMKYYAHFGHKDFILCLGWKANQVKEYFLNYNECTSNDFVLTSGGANVNLLSSDIDDWSITFIDTGTTANIGQRLKAVEPLLRDEHTFLANYTDGLSDLNLPDLVDFHSRKEAIATFLSVRPTQSFHEVTTDEEGLVRRIRPICDAGVWMNGGFFVFDQRIFQHIEPGEELVQEPFARLISDGRLHTLKYDGFWSCMDTYKEKQSLDSWYARDDTPWEVWKRPADQSAQTIVSDGAAWQGPMPSMLPTGDST